MSTCRSCKAPIEWFTTVAGKAIPLDPGPVEDGNLVITKSGEVQALGQAELDALPADAVRWRSHYATCPDAAAWRGKKQRR